MPDYRAYLVGHDGHFFNFRELVCADDAEALEKAKQLVDGHDVELWSGARLVKLIKHNHTSDEVRAFDRQLEQSRRMSIKAIDEVARFDKLTSDLKQDRDDQKRRDEDDDKKGR